MIKIRFDYCTVTISDGFVQAPPPTLTALLDALAAAPCKSRLGGNCCAPLLPTGHTGIAKQ